MGARLRRGLGLGAGPAQAALSSSYPPALDKLRGHSDTAMNVAFGRCATARSGRALARPRRPVRRTISWWSAAARPARGRRICSRSTSRAKCRSSRNNDDFGGFTRRNEFTTDAGRTVEGYGGRQFLPLQYSDLFLRADARGAGGSRDRSSRSSTRPITTRTGTRIASSAMRCSSPRRSSARIGLVLTTRCRGRVGCRCTPLNEKAQGRPDRADRCAA